MSSHQLPVLLEGNISTQRVLCNKQKITRLHFIFKVPSFDFQPRDFKLEDSVLNMSLINSVFLLNFLSMLHIHELLYYHHHLLKLSD